MGIRAKCQEMSGSFPKKKKKDKKIVEKRRQTKRPVIARTIFDAPVSLLYVFIYYSCVEEQEKEQDYTGKV